MIGKTRQNSHVGCAAWVPGERSEYTVTSAGQPTPFSSPEPARFLHKDWRVSASSRYYFGVHPYGSGRTKLTWCWVVPSNLYIDGR